jgi:hypothetical protein
VENKEFQKFVGLLRPGINIPGRTALREDLDRQYSNVIQQMFSDLPPDSKISIALDGWQSPFKKSFLAVTAYYITADWKWKEVLIGFEHIKGNHTGSTMAQTVHRILDQFELTDRLYCITTDNASNNGKMRKELESMLNSSQWSSEGTKIPCMAHVIQLVVKAIFHKFEIPSNQDVETDEEPDVSGHTNDCGSVSDAIKKVCFNGLTVTVNSNANNP